MGRRDINRMKAFELSSENFQMLLEASAAVNQMSVFAVLSLKNYK